MDAQETSRGYEVTALVKVPMSMVVGTSPKALTNKVTPLAAEEGCVAVGLIIARHESLLPVETDALALAELAVASRCGDCCLLVITNDTTYRNYTIKQHILQMVLRKESHISLDSFEPPCYLQYNFQQSDAASIDVHSTGHYMLKPDGWCCSFL
jgi:hypothetical protein